MLMSALLIMGILLLISNYLIAIGIILNDEYPPSKIEVVAHLIPFVTLLLFTYRLVVSVVLWWVALANGKFTDLFRRK